MAEKEKKQWLRLRWRQIWNADELRRRKRKQKRIMAGQSGEIFFIKKKWPTMSSSAERSKRIRTEASSRILGVGKGLEYI